MNLAPQQNQTVVQKIPAIPNGSFCSAEVAPFIYKDFLEHQPRTMGRAAVGIMTRFAVIWQTSNSACAPV